MYRPRPFVRFVRVSLALIAAQAVLGGGSAAARGWSIVTVPSGGAGSRLTAVSCPASGACEAVGRSSSGPFALRGLRDAWALQPVAHPAPRLGASKSEPTLRSVSCPSSRACLAVGDYTNAGGNEAAFAERWDGSTWGLTSLPGRTPQTVIELGAVSCSAADACLAVGDRMRGIGEPMTATDDAFAETWAGSRWRVSSPQPLSPAGGGGAEGATNDLGAVSCVRGHGCLALGDASTGANCPRCGILAEQQTGRRWLLERPVQVGDLAAVACPAENRCVAVGASAAQLWNGRAWRRRRIPAAFDGHLDAVACPALDACVAAGVDREDHILVVAWNGRAWSRQPTPAPDDARSISVTGVSCRAAGACVLVGSDRGATGRTPLLEVSG